MRLRKAFLCQKAGTGCDSFRAEFAEYLEIKQ